MCIKLRLKRCGGGFGNWKNKQPLALIRTPFSERFYDDKNAHLGAVEA